MSGTSRTVLAESKGGSVTENEVPVAIAHTEHSGSLGVLQQGGVGRAAGAKLIGSSQRGMTSRAEGTFSAVRSPVSRYRCEACTSFCVAGGAPDVVYTQSVIRASM